MLRIETAVVENKRIYHVGDNHKSRPEELDFPNTMTDIDYHTWMLSGSAVMRDGQVRATNCLGETIIDHSAFTVVSFPRPFGTGTLATWTVSLWAPGSA